MLSAFARTPAPDLILAAFVLGMAGFVLLAEFLPRRGKRDRDDDTGDLPLPA
jgi:hypothetical protein